MMSHININNIYPQLSLINMTVKGQQHAKSKFQFAK